MSKLKALLRFFTGPPKPPAPLDPDVALSQARAINAMPPQEKSAALLAFPVERIPQQKTREIIGELLAALQATISHLEQEKNALQRRVAVWSSLAFIQGEPNPILEAALQRLLQKYQQPIDAVEKLEQLSEAQLRLHQMKSELKRKREELFRYHSNPPAIDNSEVEKMLAQIEKRLNSPEEWRKWKWQQSKEVLKEHLRPEEFEIVSPFFDGGYREPS